MEFRIEKNGEYAQFILVENGKETVVFEGLCATSVMNYTLGYMKGVINGLQIENKVQANIISELKEGNK